MKNEMLSMCANPSMRGLGGAKPSTSTSTSIYIQLYLCWQQLSHPKNYEGMLTLGEERLLQWLEEQGDIWERDFEGNLDALKHSLDSAVLSDSHRAEIQCLILRAEAGFESVLEVEESAVEESAIQESAIQESEVEEVKTKEKVEYVEFDENEELSDSDDDDDDEDYIDGDKDDEDADVVFIRKSGRKRPPAMKRFDPCENKSKKRRNKTVTFINLV